MDPRRVLAHTEPAAVYARQWDAAKAEDNRIRWAPWNDAMRRMVMPGIRAILNTPPLVSESISGTFHVPDDGWGFVEIRRTGLGGV